MQYTIKTADEIKKNYWLVKWDIVSFATLIRAVAQHFTPVSCLNEDLQTLNTIKL